MRYNEGGEHRSQTRRRMTLYDSRHCWMKTEQGPNTYDKHERQSGDLIVQCFADAGVARTVSEDGKGKGGSDGKDKELKEQKQDTQLDQLEIRKQFSFNMLGLTIASMISQEDGYRVTLISGRNMP